VSPHGVAHEELRVQIEAQLRIPMRRVGVDERAHVDEPDDVGDPREPAENVVGLVDRRRGTRLGGDVGRDRVSVNLRGDSPRPVSVEVDDGDARTCLRQQYRGQASAS
jgi:hypothetical protein